MEMSRHFVQLNPTFKTFTLLEEDLRVFLITLISLDQSVTDKQDVVRCTMGRKQGVM